MAIGPQTAGPMNAGTVTTLMPGNPPLEGWNPLTSMPEIKTDELENLAEGMEEDELKSIADQCIQEYESDDADRQEWLDRHARWMRLYHQQDKPINIGDREWGSEDSLPVLAEACNQFASRAFKAFFPNQNIIECKPVGKISKGEWERATRVKKHLSWQVLVRDRGYKKNKRRLLLSVAVHGSHFTKSSHDPKTERSRVENVRAEDLVVPYGTGPRDIEDVERKTHTIWMAVGKGRRLAKQGFFVKEPEKWESGTDKQTTEASQNAEGLEPSGEHESAADECFVLEQHRWLDIDGEEKPYIVWVDAQARDVLRIVRRWDDDPTEPVEYFTHYAFIENPDGFYGLGMGHLVGEINKSVNALLRQTLDAATLANVGNQSGFMSGAVAPQGGETRLELGKFKKLSGSVEDLQKGIFTLKFPGPSQAMADIISLQLARSDRLSSVTEMVSGAAEKIMQPTAVLALIEQALEQYSAIYEGLFDAWGEELQKLYRLNGKYLPVEEYFTVHDTSGSQEDARVMQLDYQQDFQVVPLADPKMATMQQRLTRGEVEWNFVNQYHQIMAATPPPFQPFIYQEAVRYAATLEMDDIDQKLSPPPPPPEPQRVDDAKIENMMALMPEQPQVPEVHADQNHLQHLKIHEEFMNDPAYAERLPPGGKEAMDRHIQTHIALLYGVTEANIGDALESGQGGDPGMAAQPGQPMAPAGP